MFEINPSTNFKLIVENQEIYNHKNTNICFRGSAKSKSTSLQTPHRKFDLQYMILMEFYMLNSPL